MNEISKCLSYNILLLIDYKKVVQRKNKFFPSPYFFNTILNNNFINNNKRSLRDCLKCIKKNGMIDLSIFKKESIINDDIENIALNYNNISFKRLKNNIENIKITLCNNYPIIINIPIYSGFINSKKSGDLHCPEEHEKLIGSLTTLIIGYIEKNKNVFVVKCFLNEIWGDDSYMYIPFEYVNNYIKDLWILDFDIDFFNNYNIKKNLKIKDIKPDNDINKNKLKLKKKMLAFI